MLHGQNLRRATYQACNLSTRAAAWHAVQDLKVGGNPAQKHALTNAEGPNHMHTSNQWLMLLGGSSSLPDAPVSEALECHCSTPWLILVMPAHERLPSLQAFGDVQGTPWARLMPGERQQKRSPCILHDSSVCPWSQRQP